MAGSAGAERTKSGQAGQPGQSGQVECDTARMGSSWSDPVDYGPVLGAPVRSAPAQAASVNAASAQFAAVQSDPGQAASVQAAPAATYWRRRFVILAIGLGVLAAASWGLSEALVVHPAGGPTGRAGSSSGSGADSGEPGSAAGGAHGVQGRGNTNPGGSGTAGNGTRRTSGGQAAGPGPVSRSSPAPKPSAAKSAFGGFKPAFCSWHSIVLSASATQASYRPGEHPGFSLSVVSTQPKDCSFNVGSGHLALVIKEGPARIWSSADCVTGTGNLVAALRRGIPTVVTVGWDKKTSAPGCAGPAHAVPAGRYTAYAVNGSIVSAPAPFRLG
jgi:hypothetical protein